MKKLTKRELRYAADRWLDRHFIGRFEIKSSYKKTVDFHLEFMKHKYTITYDVDVLWRWFLDGWHEEFEREMKEMLTKRGHYVEQKQAFQIYI